MNGTEKKELMQQNVKSPKNKPDNYKRPEVRIWQKIDRQIGHDHQGIDARRMNKKL